jgi:polyphenol oxidase
MSIVHGYSTRKNGDMRELQNRLSFLHSVGLTSSRLITPKQTHGNRVVVAENHVEDRGLEADGLIALSDTNIAVGVIVADCVPLLFSDKKGRAIGAVHAGWKGTKGNIALQAVLAFETHGIQARDVSVFIGPHIGKCCYNVPEERANQFLSTSEKREGEWYVDLGRANVLQLLQAGILEKNINNGALCTSCHTDTYYSYRKDSQQTYGEILALIGFT